MTTVSSAASNADREIVISNIVAPVTIAAVRHTGRRSCFYRAVVGGEAGGPKLAFVAAERVFDPQAVYGKPGHSHD